MSSDKYRETVAVFAQSTFKEFGHDPQLLALASDAAMVTCAAIVKAMQTSRRAM